MLWKVDQVCIEYGKVKELIFLVDGTIRIFITLGPKGGLKKKVWDNGGKLKSMETTERQALWLEINQEAKNRLGLAKNQPKKQAANSKLKADSICYEIAETEAYWLQEQVEKKFTFLRRRHSKKNRTDIVDELIKKQAKELSFEKIPYGQKSNYRRLRSFGIKFLTDGCLALSRWTKTKGSLKIDFPRFSDLEAAIRSQVHIVEKYQNPKTGEQKMLNTIEQIISRANELLVNWGRANSKQKSQIKKDLLSVVANLFYCTNEFKEKACEQALKAVSLKDRLNRTNPPAMAARTQAALENLIKRFEELRLIEPFIAMRQELLIVEREKEKFLFAEAVKYARRSDARTAVRIINPVILSPWFARKNLAEHCLLMSLAKAEQGQIILAKNFLAQAVKILQSD